ncbi:MAG: UPF0175 family protein [Schwartzia sp.]|nr:UPF0175 family protein [Schwartzia sp. (in: firmicutes)]
MCSLSIQVPEEVLLCINTTEQDLSAYTSKLLAMNLYEQHRISLGYGAQIAGMPEEDFIYELGRAGISIFSFASKEEMASEFTNA